MKLVIISAIWCPSCLLLNKIKKKIKESFQGLAIEELDFDLDEEEVERYSVSNILPVLVFEDENGNEITRLVGEHTYKEISDILEANK